MDLKTQLTDDMKSAMRTRDKERLAVIRMVNAAIKQRELDEQAELDNPRVLALIEKMVKQRRDAEQQYREAERPELADAEAAEIAVLENYLPQQLTDDEIDARVTQAIEQTGATSMKDMGAVMGWLKPQLQGQADMAVVSQRLKAALAG